MEDSDRGEAGEGVRRMGDRRDGVVERLGMRADANAGNNGKPWECLLALDVDLRPSVGEAGIGGNTDFYSQKKHF